MTAPCIRLAALGAPKHGKTTFLRALAAHLGSWNKALLTVEGQSDLFSFCIEELNQSLRTLRILVEKSLLLDGFLLVLNLSEPLDESIAAHLNFASKIGISLRLIVATHCEAFDGDEAMLDEYELELKKQLAALGLKTDLIPVIRSEERLIEQSAQECIDALHKIDWGVPLSERPLQAIVLKSKPDVAPWYEVYLQQGTLRLHEEIEFASYEPAEVPTTKFEFWGGIGVKDIIARCSTAEGEREFISAPAVVSLWLRGLTKKRKPGDLLGPVGGIKLGQRAKARVYLGDAQGMIQMWLPKSNGELIQCTQPHEGPTEVLRMFIAPPKGYINSQESCEVQLEFGAATRSFFLYKGMGFFWRAVGGYQGGGVITEVL